MSASATQGGHRKGEETTYDLYVYAHVKSFICIGKGR